MSIALLAAAVVDREDGGRRESVKSLLTPWALRRRAISRPPCRRVCSVVSVDMRAKLIVRSGRAGRPPRAPHTVAAHVAYEARMTNDPHPCSGRAACPMMLSDEEHSWHEDLLASRHRPDAAGRETAGASLSVRPATRSSRERGPPTRLALLELYPQLGPGSDAGPHLRQASAPAAAPARSERPDGRPPRAAGRPRRRARAAPTAARARACPSAAPPDAGRSRRGRTRSSRCVASVTSTASPVSRVSLLDARGRVDRVPDDGELDVAAAADRPGDDRAPS